MRTAYVSGPMQGYEEYNFPAFDKAAEKLKEEGWVVLNPADMDRTCPVPESWSWEERRYAFMSRDLNAILSMRGSRGDAIFVLPGWTQSPGALAEVALARSMKIPVRPMR